jgi:hypothetical protein
MNLTVRIENKLTFRCPYISIVDYTINIYNILQKHEILLIGKIFLGWSCRFVKMLNILVELPVVKLFVFRTQFFA